jgi:hypothetical protein
MAGAGSYTTLVVREQGGSEFHVFAGGSITFDAGGVLVNPNFNGINLTGGSITHVSGTLDKFAAGASLNIDAGPSATVLSFSTGTSLVGIYAGFDVPSFTAVPGSLYIRAQGSMSGLFTNIGQDNASSAWRAFQQGSAIG